MYRHVFIYLSLQVRVYLDRAYSAIPLFVRVYFNTLLSLFTPCYDSPFIRIALIYTKYLDVCVDAYLICIRHVTHAWSDF